MSNKPLPENGRLGGGSDPSYDESMDRRLVVLETRFDVILPTLATKHDLELLRADLKADINAGIESLRHDTAREFENLRHEMMTMLKWVIALTISMLIAFCGTTFAMINATKAAPPARSAATAPQPPPSPAPGPLFR